MGELQAERRTAAVPFLDLARVNGPLKEAVLRDVAALIDSNAFTNGPQVEQFEQAWADYCGTRYCVGLASGLDALRLALIALELEAGDEVIVPANTFIASVEAITQAGGTPVLVDATDADWNIDVEAAEAAVSPRTRAIMPVHLYGQMADMVALRDLAERHGLAIVEDACQAHGATRDGFRAGAAGTAGAFSFYPAKNLGAFGDAGALVTDDEQLAVKMRALREHGQRAKYEHEREGFTARLDTIQAVVLASKLPLLDAWTADRRRVATQYLVELVGINDLALPLRPHGSDPVWHLFVICVPDADRLAETLRAAGVATGKHYPEAIHLMRAYAKLGHRPGDFPVAERLARHCLSLPIFAGMTSAETNAVVAAIDSALGRD